MHARGVSLHTCDVVLLTPRDSRIVTREMWWSQGCTALHKAACAQQTIMSRIGIPVESDAEASPETLKVLIQNGANVNAATQDVCV